MHRATDLELMGAAEAASYLRVDRSYITKLRATTNIGFPEPLQLACGPIWTKEEIVEFDKRWTRRGVGRPRKTA